MSISIDVTVEQEDNHNGIWDEWGEGWWVWMRGWCIISYRVVLLHGIGTQGYKEYGALFVTIETCSM